MNFETDKWSKWKTLIKLRRFKSKFGRKTGTAFVFGIVEPVLFAIAAIYFYILTSSSSSQIFIDSDRDRDHNYSIYDIYANMGWGIFNWNSALKCNSATFLMIEAYSLQCFIVNTFTDLHITSPPLPAHPPLPLASAIIAVGWSES